MNKSEVSMCEADTTNEENISNISTDSGCLIPVSKKTLASVFTKTPAAKPLASESIAYINARQYSTLALFQPGNTSQEIRDLSTEMWHTVFKTSSEVFIEDVNKCYHKLFGYGSMKFRSVPSLGINNLFPTTNDCEAIEHFIMLSRKSTTDKDVLDHLTTMEELWLTSMKSIILNPPKPPPPPTGRYTLHSPFTKHHSYRLCSARRNC